MNKTQLKKEYSKLAKEIRDELKALFPGFRWATTRASWREPRLRVSGMSGTNIVFEISNLDDADEVTRIKNFVIGNWGLNVDKEIHDNDFCEYCSTCNSFFKLTIRN